MYVTGSYGRGEASDHSDLDLFVVTDLSQAEHDSWASQAQGSLDMELASAKRNHGFPDSPGSAEYEVFHSVEALVGSLGEADDDTRNTFTARLLLLLESRALLGESVYTNVIDRVVTAYWRDFEGHESSFVPGFLVNDILRMWRTFCVNYEARTKSDPQEKKAKRSLKNYKLKHSRLLTCYSALAYLLVVFGEARTVKPEDVRQMVALSPLERIDWIATRSDNAKAHVDLIRTQYERFLDAINASEADLVTRFLDREERNRHLDEAKKLGDAMYALIGAVGGGTELHRILVV